ncbi:MAG: metallophosphoesterase family protein [Promethearchaeota archaeon]
MIQTDKQELLIGLIGDTHIPSQASAIPEQIINDFKKRKIDYLIHLGDFTDFEIYNYLQETFGEDKIIGIQGNMDTKKVKDTLPQEIELNLYGHKLLITHGSRGPNDIIERLSKANASKDHDIIIFGHVHRPFNERWKDGKLYLCPGSPTDKVFTNINSYGFLRISEKLIEPEIVVL